jgi:hypothetical protein
VSSQVKLNSLIVRLLTPDVVSQIDKLAKNARRKVAKRLTVVKTPQANGKPQRNSDRFLVGQSNHSLLTHSASIRASPPARLTPQTAAMLRDAATLEASQTEDGKFMI